MSSDREQKLTPSDQVLVQKVADESVLLHLEKQEYYGLNEVGTRIWELLAAGNTTTRVAEVIVEEFAVERATAESDIEAFITRLRQDELIQG